MSKIAYTLIAWFAVGLLIGVFGIIYTGSFDIIYALELGFAYVIYPVTGYFLFIFANDSGSQHAYEMSVKIFGSLAIIYILIPIVVSYLVDKRRKKG